MSRSLLSALLLAYPTHVLFSALVLAILFSTKLSAQTTTSGGLAGVVTDPTSAVVFGAQIAIKAHSKGTTQSTKTDHEGVYRFFFLEPGKYTLIVTCDGYGQESRTVNVLLGPPISVNVPLSIANPRTTVNVTGEVPLLQAENGDPSATMNQQQISEVPNPGNDLTYIVQTAPGVVMNTDVQGGANFSVLGMPAFSYLHTIDGMNDNDNAVNLSMTGSLFLLGRRGSASPGNHSAFRRALSFAVVSASSTTLCRAVSRLRMPAILLS